ncbi:MAG: RHS repeat-associated core domain-containing protein, partial [Myxococcota bacterium]
GSTNRAYIAGTDHLGAPLRLFNTTNGEIDWLADAEPFGAYWTHVPSTAIDPSLEFNVRGSNQYFDAETGLHANWYRYYDPNTGRYITEDPLLREIPGFEQPSAAFAMNNPGAYVDPDGRQIPPVFWPPEWPPELFEIVVDLVSNPSQTIDATQAMYDTYQEMLDANFKNQDKYFHCKANCLAVRVAPDAGESASKYISDWREYTDMLLKGDTPKQCEEDRRANRRGRFAEADETCRQACEDFRPPGLPAFY